VDAWELLEKTSRLLKDQLEYLPASDASSILEDFWLVVLGDA
jgi:hypothetical protein